MSLVIRKIIIRFAHSNIFLVVIYQAFTVGGHCHQIALVSLYSGGAEPDIPHARHPAEGRRERLHQLEIGVQSH